jgi:hypothetical protein
VVRQAFATTFPGRSDRGRDHRGASGQSQGPLPTTIAG